MRNRRYVSEKMFDDVSCIGRDNCTSTIKGIYYRLNHCNFILTISILLCMFFFFSMFFHTLIKALYLVTLRCGAAFLILEKRNSKKVFLFEMRLFDILKLSRQYHFLFRKKRKIQRETFRENEKYVLI